MIIDISGTELIPGNGGKDCPGNGENGECCCDECDYLICCFYEKMKQSCGQCRDPKCQRAGNCG